MIESDARSLINAMRDGEHLRLIDHEITGLLSWMAGSSRSREARELIKAFGEAGQHGKITARGFLLLDRALFKDQQLLEEIAGVGENRSADERRRRFRLLLSAFHPDRYPDRAEWLTERSQIITIAYSRFKSGKAPARPPLPVVKRKPAVVRKRPRRFVRPSTQWVTRLARTLQKQFGGDPWLAQKIIGGFALILLLPLVSVLLDTQTPLPVRSEPGETQRSTRAPSDQQTTESVPASATPNATASTDSQATAITSKRAERIGPSSIDNHSLTERMAERASDRDETFEPRMGDEAQEPVLIASNDPEPSLRGQGNRATAQVSEAASEQMSAEARPLSSADQATALERRTERANESIAAVEPQLIRPLESLNQASARPVDRPTRASDGVSISEPESAPSVAPRASGLIAQTNQNPALSAGDQTAAVAETPSGSKKAADGTSVSVAQADRPADQPPEARGSLLLGPLGSHQIGTLLQQYQLALEQSDLQMLSDLVGSELTEKLQNLFPELFESSQQHRVDLSIVQSQREGDQWVIQLEQNVGVSAIDRRARNFSHRAEFRFRTDPYAIRIVDVNF